MFVCALTYHREIDHSGSLFAAHRAFIGDLAADNRLLCSGPRRDTEGGVVIVYGDDEPATRRLFDEDPLVAGGLATYDLIPFAIGICDPSTELVGR